MTAPDTVLYEVAGGVATLTLNRPQAHNALDLRMRDDLWALLDVVEADDDVLVVLLRGAGPSFCSGADLNDFGTSGSYVEARRGRQERDLWGRLAYFEKPLVASLHGYALGAGLEMSLLSDFRIASEDAMLGLPEVGLGYLPSAGGTQSLPRLIGPGRGLDMILTGDPISATRALEYGIIRRVVPQEALATEALALAQRLANLSPRAVRLTKRAVLRGLDLNPEQGLQLESLLAARLRAGDDGRPA
jgi:enoyl-CoA hydratase/carnithine racemase